MMPAFVVPAVATTATTDAAPAGSAARAARSASPVSRWSGVATGKARHPQQVQRVADR